jgi:hydrogenase expression/formation protein HypD
MKYIDEYRDKKTVRELAESIRRISKKPIKIVEVCGGHTVSIHKFGIPSLLPDHITLVSGPGCPVCVSSRRFIDQAIAYSRLPNAVIATFGDLIRVPGSTSSLEKEKANGADIRIVYSALDALDIAIKEQEKKIVFLGIGFETTAPGTAATIFQAAQKKANNFYVFSSHKIMPPAMAALVDEGVKLDGYLAPGHVTAITGTSIFEFIPEKYKLGVVVSGFEPVDILQSVLMLVRQIEEMRPSVEIQYRRAVRQDGNPKAMQMMWEVFETRDDWWRGLGILPGSGLAIKQKYSAWDAEKCFMWKWNQLKKKKAASAAKSSKDLNHQRIVRCLIKLVIP